MIEVMLWLHEGWSNSKCWLIPQGEIADTVRKCLENSSQDEVSYWYWKISSYIEDFYNRVLKIDLIPKSVRIKKHLRIWNTKWDIRYFFSFQTPKWEILNGAIMLSSIKPSYELAQRIQNSWK